jgi:hypothetical protein
MFTVLCPLIFLARFLPRLGRISIFQRLQPQIFPCELHESESSPTLLMKVFLLSFLSRILKGFFNSCTSAKYSHAHKGAICPELSCSFDLQEKLVLFPLSLKWRIWMPSWLSVYSSNLLLSTSGYSVTLCICSTPTWQSLLQNSSEILSSSELNRVPSVRSGIHSMSTLHLLNALLAELSES